MYNVYGMKPQTALRLGAFVAGAGMGLMLISRFVEMANAQHK